jgi:hypothetical protein
VPVSRPPGLVFRTLLREPVLVAAPLDHFNFPIPSC